ANAPLDASDTGSDASAALFTGIRLDKGLCLPQAFPQNAAGLLDCRIVLGVPGTCDSSDGLSPATDADVARLQADAARNDASVPSGSICALKQLTGAATSGTGCTDEKQDAWCYVNGSCRADAGTACQHDICTTDAFDTAFHSGTASPGYWGAWLVC